MSILKATSRRSMFFLGHEEVSSSWLADHRDGLQDTSSASTMEITTIPFSGDEFARPDATFGICVSG